MAATILEKEVRLALGAAVFMVAVVGAVSQSSAATVSQMRPSVSCPGAIDTVNVDDTTGTVINVANVSVPSGVTATCVTNPGIAVEVLGTGSTLINNVQGLQVIATGAGDNNTIVNNGNIPSVIMEGNGATITNNMPGTSGGVGTGAIGFAIIGDDGIIGNAGTVQSSGTESIGLGITGNVAKITNTGTVIALGTEATAIVVDGDNAEIINSGIAETIGNESAALFIVGNAGTITNSGRANGLGPFASAISIQGDTAVITNDGDVTANFAFAIGLSAIGNDATLTNNKNVSVSGGLAGMGVVGDDATLTNTDTVTTTGANALGMVALGGMGAMNRGETLTNAAGGTITTGGDGAHGIALGLENLTAIAGPIQLPPGATNPAQGNAVNNGTIVTSGVGADGLHAFASAGGIENRGTITTSSADANGMEARGAGPGVLTATNLNLITATGDNASAMHGAGQNVALINGRADGSAPGADLQVTTGTKVRGFSLNGVDSRIENYGNVNVTSGIVQGANSFLDFSHGIVVQGGTGSQTTTIGGVARQGSNNTVINKGTISANTQAGRSIVVDTKGVTIENQAGGVLDDGVLFNLGSSGVLNNGGTINGGILDSISLFGGPTGSIQVLAEINNAAGGTIAGSTNAIGLIEADAFITNNGTISVSGPNALSAITIGLGSSQIINRGTVTTMGTDAVGVNAFTFDASGQLQKSLAANIQNFGTITAGSGIATLTASTSSILNGGTITATANNGFAISGQSVDVGAAVNIINQGMISTTGDSTTGIVAFAAGGDVTVENTSTGTITTTGDNASGIVASSPAQALNVINGGTIMTSGAAAHGVSLTFDGTVTNRGTIAVTDSTANAVFFDQNASPQGFSLTLVNEAAGTLSSSAVTIKGSESGDNVTNMGTINGDVALSGGNDTFTVHDGSTLNGSVFAGADSGDKLIANFASNSGLNGSQYVSFDQFDKTGTGQLDFSGTMSVGNTDVQQGGFMLQSGSNLISNVNVAAGAEIGGSAATVTGNISGAGTIAPGLSPGQLDVIGDIDLSGKLAIEIAGLGTGQFDVLNVAGSLNFQAAEIEFTFLNNFVPMAGDVFSFLSVTGALTGFNTTFFTFIGAPQGSNLNVALNPLSGGGFELGLAAMAGTPTTSVPEPGSLALFVIGLGGLAGLARRRRGALNRKSQQS